jgi:hypothetical protein
MSDFNLFSSKTDIKKLLFTTEKFKFNDQCSNDSWQDLPGVTPTSVLASFVDNQNIQSPSLSSLSDNRNENGWETLDDYSIIPKSYGINYEKSSKKPAGYGRLDRRGHWLLLQPPPLLQSNSKKIITYYDKQRLSRDPIQQLQTVEQIFPDSCESLTVSVDLHVPTDEIMTDQDDTDGQNTLVWGNKTPHHQNITSDPMRRISR